MCVWMPVCLLPSLSTRLPAPRTHKHTHSLPPPPHTHTTHVQPLRHHHPPTHIHTPPPLKRSPQNRAQLPSSLSEGKRRELFAWSVVDLLSVGLQNSELQLVSV